MEHIVNISRFCYGLCSLILSEGCIFCSSPSWQKYS